MAAARARRYLEPFFKHRLVTSVSREDLRRYRLWLQGQKISLQTVAHVLADARCFFLWCEDVGLVERAPIPQRLLPRIKQRPPDRLDDDEVERLVQLPDPHGFVIRLGLETGLRWGEMVCAQASHVMNGVLVVGETKSGKVRRIPLPPDLLAEVRTRVGRLVPFASSISFNRIVRRKSGIARFHVHQTRHTFGCRWLERGGSLAALQELMGHASITTTERYARLSDDMVKREVERVAAE
jgi:integrase